MRSLFSSLSGWPSWLQYSVPAFAGGICVALVGLLHLDRTGLLILLLCIVAVVAIIVGYLLLLRWIRWRRSRPFTQNLKSSASRSPQTIAEPAQRAQLDSLRKTFENGIEKFEAAGKDLYSLPWYLIVGEPGSGKTEAIRHCNVGFPPGLQNQLQGVGGTINMGWWFTNHAVILDTAGRMLFQEVQAGNSTEWTEFLRLLIKSRPECPVNGLILVIPADSLILDTADKIEAKAGKIAQQFDVIQRALGVRFPVFIMITKCDLINGFREFFDGLSDIKLQHQILGWSNPNPLDSLFNPDEVDKHLAAVRHRLLLRRYGLLLDPVSRESVDARRADEVDSLYSLPDRLMTIAPRLRRYLEMVFVPGEWSSKPLFLRGIYFTSSMREGTALDAELAETLNVPVSSLPEGRGWERERAYFLRDLFVKKIFVEKGLVTRAVNTQSLQRRRRFALIGTGVSSALLLLLLTWYGSVQMNRSINEQTRFWADANQHLTDNLQLVVRNGRTTDGRPKFATQIDRPVSAELGNLGQMHARAIELIGRPIQVNWILRPAGKMIDSGSALTAREGDAYRKLFISDVLMSTMDAVSTKLDAEVASTWSPQATAALIQLIRFQHGKAEPELTPLLRYALPDSEFAKFNQESLLALQSGLQNVLHSPGSAVPLLNDQTIAGGVECFVDHWEWERSGRNPELAVFAAARQAAHDAQGAAEQMSRFSAELSDHSPRTSEQYAESCKDWNTFYDRQRASVQSLRERLAVFVPTDQGRSDLVGSDLERRYQEKLNQIQRDGRAEYESLIAEVQAGLATHSSIAARVSAEISAQVSAQISNQVASQLGGPTASQPSAQSLPPTSPRLEKLTDAAANFRRDDERDHQFADDLASLETTLLRNVKCSDGLTHPIYMLSQINGDIVRASLPVLATSSTLPVLPTTTPVGDWTTLKADDQEITDRSTRAATSLVRLAGESDAHDSAGADGDTIVLHRLDEPCRRYQLLTQALADAPTGAEAIIGLVEKIASRVQGVTVSGLPFVAAKQIDPGFQPRAAADALSYGSLIEKYVNLSPVEPPATLNATSIAEEYQQSLKRALDQYRQKYIDYWCTSLLTPKIDSPQRWNTVWQQLAAVHASDIDTSLIETEKQVQSAMDVVNANCSAEQKKTIDDEEDAIRHGLETATDAAPTIAFSNVLDGWHKLGGSPTVARETILGQQPGTFSRLCLIRIVEGQPRDVSIEYWNRLTMELLRALAADPEAHPNGIQALSKYDLFPLANSTAELDPTRDLPAVRKQVDELSVIHDDGVSANPVHTIHDGGRLRNADDINDEFDHLCGTFTAKDREKITHLQQLLSALPASGSAMQCKISVPPEAVQRRLKRDFSRVEGDAVDQFTSMALIHGNQPVAQRDRVAPWSSDQPSLLGDARYPGDPVQLALYAHPDDIEPTARIPASGQMKSWECLRWLRDNNAQHADKNDASQWYVEFVIDKQFSLWLQLTFTKPLPDTDSWK